MNFKFCISDIYAVELTALYIPGLKTGAFRARTGNDAILKSAVNQQRDFKILAVTALTCLDEYDMDSLGFKCSVEDLILSRAQRAFDLGCEGIVSSGLELPILRKALGDEIIAVVPGIRPVENKPIDDQKRTIDVETAIRLGADHIVVGRAVTGSYDPRETVKGIHEQILAATG